MDEHRQTDLAGITLPRHARLPVSRCNLPPQILGSLTFQQHPTTLQLDGVEALHGHLFKQLDGIDDPAQRAELFQLHMRASFNLDHPDETGLQSGRQQLRRDRADYLRMLRGWMFDADGLEAAVLKSWVESRFGLLPRNHRGPLGDFSGPNYQAYLAARANGLYNSNALEAQIDLLFSYCQYELTRCRPGQTHMRLYRGLNRISEHEILKQQDKGSCILLLNNLNSFSGSRERADEFGDYILQVEVPLSKLLFMPGLLPRTLKGEMEYLVIGGIYQADVSTL